MEKLEGCIIEQDGAGHITVRQERSVESYFVDASNPLLDSSIVRFWKTFPGSENVKWQVERIADGYRRFLLTSGEWESIVAEAKAANKGEATANAA